MTLVQLENVVCDFKTDAGLVHAVAGVDFAIRTGETYALVGESGCGKSTLAKLILGLERLTAGRILFEGQDLATLRGADYQNYRRRVQAVFQDPFGSLNPRMKVASILAEPLRAHRVGKAKRTRRITELMELVGLDSSAATLYPHEFSGGQRQRIAIARALALQPSLVVLDEPISALDVSIRAQILNLLQDLQDEFALTYLLIAHDLALVEHASDRIGVMYLGRLVEQGEAAAVFDNPVHPYTKALLASVPRPDPSHPRSSGNVIHGEVPNAMRPPSGCAFHPRCPNATDLCVDSMPKPISLPGDHMVGCHHWEGH